MKASIIFALSIVVLLPYGPLKAQSVTPNVAKPTQTKQPALSPDILSDKKTHAVYTNTDIGFSFTYPAELHSESAESLAEKWKQATNKSDPKYKASDACTHVLFHAEQKGKPGEPGIFLTIHGEDHSPKTEITIPVTGSVIITEMNQQCLPAEFKGREDEVLSGFASSVGEEPGMKLIGQPMWYEVEGHKIHAGVAKSIPNSVSANDGDHAASRTDYLVDIASNINGHLVIFMIEAQNRYSINKLIHGAMRFGNNEPKPLLPLNITE
jgi:hypothetical protein